MFMTPRPDGLSSEQSSLERGNPAQDSYAFLRVVVEELINAKLIKKEFKNADTLTQVLWGSLHGLVSLHLVMKNDDWIEWRPLEETTDQLIAALMRGLLREPAK